MKKIKSGVYGLNTLMNGGINENSTTVVVGSSGAGKTTLAIQFLRRGLETGEDGIFLSMDEVPEQIIKQAAEMGWNDIQNYVDEGTLVFIDAGGKQFSSFIQKELADFVEEWKGYKARIVIDPLTPVLWYVREKYEQRELVSFLLRQTRKIGTVLCTLEEHGTIGDLSGPEIIIPMYLADNVIHLRYISKENPERRELKIIKCRLSKHSRFSHPYVIMKGVGVVIRRGKIEPKEPKKSQKIKEEIRETVTALAKKRDLQVSEKVLKNIQKSVDYLLEEDLNEIDPKEVLDLILAEYDLSSEKE